ncbi:hypothetical protein [Treponema sp.]|uniref:hypothetical protein n=1 Tax=Treponema sp. TaxID=166 RepID=UPI00389040ED
MKKYISKLTVLLVFFSTLFVSCSGVIFYDIRKEVALDDAKISGDIKSIIRWTNGSTECVAVANGNIYYRSVESSVVDSKIDWSTLSKPASNVKVEVLAADETNLYAATIVYEDDDDGYNTPTSRALYCYDGSSWTQLYGYSYSSDNFTLFCTNTPQNTNRHAYFRYGSTVWELSGTTALADITAIDTTGASDNSTTPTTGVKSCTVLGTDVYFSSAYAMTSNETASAVATYIYYCSGDCVSYSGDGSSWTAVDLNCDTIRSMAVTYDYLLVGTDEGIAHTTMSTGIPSSGTADFSTNADTTMSSYYEVQALLAVNPSKTETGGTLFSAIDTSGTSASLNNVGLWSYFASKGKWNRE